MEKTILITDTLFVYEEHERKLRDAGYSLVRLDKPQASEETLIEQIRGKVAYILGGIERVTERVIAAADQLQAIAFTGSGFSEFVPAHEAATNKGIAITAARGGNATAVAEYTIALVLLMIRRIPSVTSEGGDKFYIAKGFKDTTIGIVGYGAIGHAVASLAVSLGFRVIATPSRSPQMRVPHVEMRELSDLLPLCDVVTIHTDKLRGTHIIGAEQLRRIKDGGIVINAAFPEAVDNIALANEIRNKRLLAAYDAAPSEQFEGMPTGFWIRSNAQTAFNTQEANLRISDLTVASLLNVLQTGFDPYLVNPDYRQHRAT